MGSGLRLQHTWMLNVSFVSSWTLDASRHGPANSSARLVNVAQARVTQDAGKGDVCGHVAGVKQSVRQETDGMRP